MAPVPVSGPERARRTPAPLMAILRGVLEIAALSVAIDSAGPGDHREAAQALHNLDRAIRDQDYRAYQRESRPSTWRWPLGAGCRGCCT